MFPKQTELEVRIGPALGIAELRRRAQGMARSESYRYVTRIAEEAVKRASRGRRVLARARRGARARAGASAPELGRRPR